ncbi:MAG: hypothetical protein QOE64_1466 [Frankiales bacterium]|nr:hypothetical protein [Frankiales bacterium]
MVEPRPRTLPRVDWSLRHCARKGHITYAPTEPELRERLHAPVPQGEAWRCLRCGDFVLGEPHGSGPAEDAPLVLRGKALRDAFVLRFLAVERFLRGSLFLLLGYAVLRFQSSQASLRQLFSQDLPAAKPLADKVGVDLENGFLVTHLRSALNAKHGTLVLLTTFLLGYGAIQVLEGVGLWLLKRWGEYLAVVATSAFLPVEVYELSEKVTWLRAGALVLNLAAVAYLLYSKRLFGIRGGGKAYEAQRHEESLLEVEASAATAT